MKTSLVAIAVALVYLVSFVTADRQMANDMNATDVSPTKRGKGRPSLILPVGVIRNNVDAKNNTILVTDSNIVISLSDRVQLAHTIKDLLPNAPETSTMSLEDLFDLLTRIATTPGVLSDAAAIISAAKSGDTGALAAHVVALLRAAAPAAPVVSPIAAPNVPQAPVVTPVDTPAIPTSSMAATHMG